MKKTQTKDASSKLKLLRASLTKAIFALLTVATLASCADPAFQQYIAQRQAAIAQMPNGPAKSDAQERLDYQIMQEKQLERQRAANAALAISAGMAAGAAAYNASRPQNVNVNVWHHGWWY
jgi:hypothetical protein